MARSGTPTKPRTAQAKAVKPIRTLKKTKSHRVRNIISGWHSVDCSFAGHCFAHTAC